MRVTLLPLQCSLTRGLLDVCVFSCACFFWMMRRCCGWLNALLFVSLAACWLARYVMRRSFK